MWLHLYIIQCWRDRLEAILIDLLPIHECIPWLLYMLVITAPSLVLWPCLAYMYVCIILNVHPLTISHIIIHYSKSVCNISDWNYQSVEIQCLAVVCTVYNLLRALLLPSYQSELWMLYHESSSRAHDCEQLFIWLTCGQFSILFNEVEIARSHLTNFARC